MLVTYNNKIVTKDKKALRVISTEELEGFLTKDTGASYIKSVIDHNTLHIALESLTGKELSTADISYKTINGHSILGKGNISIEGGSGSSSITDLGTVNSLEDDVLKNVTTVGLYKFIWNISDNANLICLMEVSHFYTIRQTILTHNDSMPGNSPFIQYNRYYSSNTWSSWKEYNLDNYLTQSSITNLTVTHNGPTYPDVAYLIKCVVENKNLLGQRYCNSQPSTNIVTRITASGYTTKNWLILSYSYSPNISFTAIECDTGADLVFVEGKNIPVYIESLAAITEDMYTIYRYAKQEDLNNYLPLSGGTMAGDIDMNRGTITGLFSISGSVYDNTNEIYLGYDSDQIGISSTYNEFFFTNSKGVREDMKHHLAYPDPSSSGVDKEYTWTLPSKSGTIALLEDIQGIGGVGSNLSLKLVATGTRDNRTASDGTQCVYSLDTTLSSEAGKLYYIKRYSDMLGLTSGTVVGFQHYASIPVTEYANDESINAQIILRENDVHIRCYTDFANDELDELEVYEIVGGGASGDYLPLSGGTMTGNIMFEQFAGIKTNNDPNAAFGFSDGGEPIIVGAGERAVYVASDELDGNGLRYTFPEKSGTIALTEDGIQWTDNIGSYYPGGKAYPISGWHIEDGDAIGNDCSGIWFSKTDAQQDNLVIFTANAVINLDYYNGGSSTTHDLHYPKTGHRVWSFPEKNGTIALTSDLSNYLSLDGSKMMLGDLNMGGEPISWYGGYGKLMIDTNQGLVVSTPAETGLVHHDTTNDVNHIYKFPKNSGTIALLEDIQGGGASGDYLSLSGGTVTGDITMNQMKGIKYTDSNVTSYFGFGDDGWPVIVNTGARAINISNSTLDDYNIYTFPEKSGIVALQEDVPSYMHNIIIELSALTSSEVASVISLMVVTNSNTPFTQTTFTDKYSQKLLHCIGEYVNSVVYGVTIGTSYVLHYSKGSTFNGKVVSFTDNVC